MSEVHRVAVEIGGTEIAFETGKMAKQASGAVTVTAGDTVVLSTATAGNLRDVDFLPLTVDVEERMYAAGKIPGSFFKREGRAGEKATLIARMIDRPLRPLFPKGWRRETQLVNLTLSVDQVHTVRRAGDERRVHRADDLRHPVSVARRRGADRQGRRQLRRQPDRGAAPHGRHGSRRGRHRRGRADGRVRRQRGARGRDPRRAGHRAFRDQEAVRRAARAGREGRQAQAWRSRSRRPTRA